MAKLLARSSLLLAISLIGGCATTDFDYPKTESFVLTNTADTELGRQVADYVAAHPENQSGFYPLYDGIDSLAIRLIMAERAERSIDAQYFLIHDDLVGNVFINALLRAANRGVRVRLLVDDLCDCRAGIDRKTALLILELWACRCPSSQLHWRPAPV